MDGRIPSYTKSQHLKERWAWDHPERLDAMGREARRKDEARYTAEKNYPNLIRIYH
jgi:hypothetical protein